MQHVNSYIRECSSTIHVECYNTCYNVDCISLYLPHNAMFMVMQYLQPYSCLDESFKEDVKRCCLMFYFGFRFTHFVDILTQEETNEVMREKRQREAVSRSTGLFW